MAKKMKLIKIISCAVVFVVGALLLILSIATPAGKTYTYKDKNDPDQSFSLVFGSKEFESTAQKDYFFKYTVKNGELISYEEVLGNDVEVPIGTFGGFKVTMGEAEFTSTGAIIQFIIGCVLMVASAGAAVYFFVLKRK